jgi:hypothetical protein
LIGLVLMAQKKVAMGQCGIDRWHIGPPYPRQECKPGVHTMSLQYYELIDAATASGIRMGGPK